VGHLGLWNRLKARHELIVAKSVIDEWDDEIVVLETSGDEAAVSRDLRDRVVASARAESRPATAPKPEDEKLRNAMGKASFGAMALSRSEARSSTPMILACVPLRGWDTVLSPSRPSVFTIAY